MFYYHLFLCMKMLDSMHLVSLLIFYTRPYFITLVFSLKIKTLKIKSNWFYVVWFTLCLVSLIKKTSNLIIYSLEYYCKFIQRLKNVKQIKKNKR